MIGRGGGSVWSGEVGTKPGLLGPVLSTPSPSPWPLLSAGISCVLPVISDN